MSKCFPYFDESLSVEERLQDLIARLTIDEKITLCSGKRLWNTRSIKRWGIKPFKMTDGPHGIGALGSAFRKMMYFPTAIARASTWNVNLSHDFGQALAEEARSIGFHMVLAPGVNIDRTPVNGRTFEYQTEDPYLNKVLAVAVIKGIQEQRVAACVKHFAVNNQETNRKKISVEVTERALEEIYFPAFKAAVTEANVWSAMASYNKINGIYGCENRYLLTTKLREDWGFKGFVVSDWLATNPTSTDKCVNAGLTLEMPGIPRAAKYNKKALRRALKANAITESTITENVRRLLRVMFYVGLFDTKTTILTKKRNTIEHKQLALKIAEESIVLLKNNKNLLPLNAKKLKTLTILGPNLDKKMAFGGGSSMVRAYYEITPYHSIKKFCQNSIKLIKDPQKADVVLIFAGLNHKRGKDSESADKVTLSLPVEQIELINHTAMLNPQTIVILTNGSPVSMEEWITNVPAVIEAWYGGAETGTAITNVIFGLTNPSGKLPLTFPKKLSDCPAHQSEASYPGHEQVHYIEDIFVGYRYFDHKAIDPQFPFGYGLSYTTFVYSNLQLSSPSLSKNDQVIISIDITNTGAYEGAETVQLYVQEKMPTVSRPPQELKKFLKINLIPAQCKTISFTINAEDLAFYDSQQKQWITNPGTYHIHIGSSSRDIRQQCDIKYVA